MRAGVVLEHAAGGDGLREVAVAVERWGLHLLWLREGPRLGAPLLQAAAAGAVTGALRIGTEVAVGDVHPLYVAEEAAAADVATGGRMVLGLRAAPGVEGGLAEALTLVRAAHAARPFRHPGPRWPTPAGLEANAFNLEDRIRVTPAPVQLELPTWVVGAPAVAAAQGLPLVAADIAAGARFWAGREQEPTALRGPRPVEVDVSRPADGRFDHRALVADLHAAQRAWGCDLVLVRLPTGAGFDVALERMARLVLPRLQLDRLPEGVVDHWERAHA